MGIEGIKRWQWILIGIVAGLGLGYVWSSGDTGDLNGASFGVTDFERELSRTNPKTKEPLLRKIVIHPSTVDRYGKTVQPVSYQRMNIAPKSGAISWQNAYIIAPVPYKPTLNQSLMEKPATGQATIKNYLTGVTKRYKDVKWRYGWESERPSTIAMWTIGATVVIGGIWPSVLSLMVGAGLGGKREAKEDFSLSSYRPTKSEEKPVVKEVSQAERDRLDEMNRRLEEQLKGAGVITDGQSDEEDPEGPILAGAVRNLDGGPLETVGAKNAADDDDEIEVKEREFYPVIVHHKKHHDENHSDNGH